MKYLYSALILHDANKEITEDAVTSILEAAGVDVDSSRVKALVAALSEVDIEDALSSAVMAAAPATGAAAPAGDSGAAQAEEEPEEEEEIEGEVVDDDEGLGSLFG
jgi:large subunit ribosomal protein L12